MTRLPLLLLFALLGAERSTCWAWIQVQPQVTLFPSPGTSLRVSYSSTNPYWRPSRSHRVEVALPSSSSFLETNEASPEQLDDADDNERYYGDDDSVGNSLSSTEPTYLANLEIGRLANLSHRNATAASVAYHILRQIEHPDTISYNGVLKALAKASFFVPRAANMCSDLLQEMEDLFEEQISANQDWYARNEQGLLSAEELKEGPPFIRIKPNIRSYSTVMDAWCRKRDGRQSAQKAQDVLDKLERLYQEQKVLHPQSQYTTLCLQPNVISYNTAIAAWAKSGVPGAPYKCIQILQSMVQRCVWPDVISYNALLHAYARSGLPNAGELAEDILRTNMTRFYSHADDTVIRKVQQQQQQQLSSKHHHQQQQQPLVQPNARTYTTVMDAWSRSVTSNDPNTSCAQRAHALLREMEDLYQQTKDEAIRPNCVSYSTVIHGYALSSQRDEPYKAYKAWQLLQEMITISSSSSASSPTAFNPLAQPSLVTYNNVLNACASSTPPHAIPATTNSKSSASEVVASSDASSPQEVKSPWSDAHLEHLALEMSLPKMVQTIYRQLLENPELQPDHFTYGTLLKAISNLRSFFNPDDGNPADFIRQVFQDCCQRGRVSSGVLYQLLQCAPLDLYRELVLDVVATPMTVPFKPSSKHKNSNLQRNDLAASKVVSIDDLPIAWTRNVRERRRRPTKSFRGNYRGNGTD